MTEIQGEMVELISEPSAMEQLAQAVLDGRVSVKQSMPSRRGTVTYSIVVDDEPKGDE